MNRKIATVILLAGVAIPCFAEEESCFLQQVGVHVTKDDDGVQRYVVVAKAEPLTPDGDSYRYAYDEAVLEAKSMLIDELGSKENTLKLSGIAEIERCQTNEKVYVRLAFGNKDSLRSMDVGSQIKESLVESPASREDLLEKNLDDQIGK